MDSLEISRPVAGDDPGGPAPALADGPPKPLAASPAEAAGQTAAAFDEPLYLALNPDVELAINEGRIVSGFAHWLDHGRADEMAGHRPSLLHAQHYRAPADPDPNPPSPRQIADFDPEAYLEANGDVHLAIGSDPQAALIHWVEHGRREGRVSSNRKTYLARSRNPAKIAERPFGVNVYAPFSARSGLGTAARGYLAALRAADIPVHLVNIDVSQGHFRVAAREVDRAGPYRINLLHVNADSLDRFYNLFPPGRFDDAYTIAIWAWELNVLRPDWHTTFAAVDEVWTPSAFNTAAVAAVSPVPVLTINHAVPPPPPHAYDRAYFGLPPGTIFLTIFDVGSSIARKNPHAVVEAFEKAFPDRTDVHLVLKLHSTHADPKAAEDFFRAVRGRTNVLIRSKSLTDDETRGLQAACDCLVSAHRSEGFGLNIAEAMQLGKPVIATRYAGSMDFTDDTNSYLIPFRMRPLDRASGPYLPGYQWAEPDIDALSSLMRDVALDPVGARRKGARAARTIAQRLSPHAIGARIIGRFRDMGLQDAPAWIRHVARPLEFRAPDPQAVIPLSDPAARAARPTISVILPVSGIPADDLERCIRSVLAQSYSRWELCLCVDPTPGAEAAALLDRFQGTDPRIRIRRLSHQAGISAASNEAVGMATGSYLLMLDEDAELTRDALHEIAAAVVKNPAIDAIYSDEEEIDLDGLCHHHHKPEWSPEHLESVMYTRHPLTLRTRLFLDLGGFRDAFAGAQDWDLMLRLSRLTQAIHHIPKILYHRRMIPGSAAAERDNRPEALNAAARALQDHVAAKYGDAARVEPAEIAGFHRVRHAVPGTPPVTLLITTNNNQLTLPGREPFVMVENLIESIRAHTEYPNYRILVVDNANTPRKTQLAYRNADVELQSYGGPTSPFNFADKANVSLRHVKTEHMVLMNDDMQAFDPDWLRALLEFSQHRDIGAAGGKLLHADGTIQHVGTVLGINGGSAHVYYGFPGDFVGYNGYTHAIRNYSALTGAGLAMRMEVLNEVGGFDPLFATHFNDTDICLRMRRHGYRLVYTPFSKLFHFEGKTSIRTSHDPAEASLFARRWSDAVRNDPFYNPNLSRTRHDYAPLAG